MVSKPRQLGVGARISKGEMGRILVRTLSRLDPTQQLAILHGETPEGWADLVEDEATRATVPNRAARRAHRFGRGLNVKQAAKRQAYGQRATRRLERARTAAAAELAAA